MTRGRVSRGTLSAVHTFGTGEIGWIRDQFRLFDAYGADELIDLIRPADTGHRYRFLDRAPHSPGDARLETATTGWRQHAGSATPLIESER